MKNQGTVLIVSSTLLSSAFNAFVLIACSGIFSTPAALAESLQGEIKEKVIQTTPARLKRNGPSSNADPFSSGGGSSSGDSGAEPGGNSGQQQRQTPDAFDTPENNSGPPKEFMVDPDGQDQRGGRGRPNNGNTARPRPRNTPAISAPTGGARPPSTQPPARPPSRPPAAVEFSAATPQADPDETREMQILWDSWHKQVAATIYKEFDRLASLQFRRGTQASCKVSYEITNAGRVRNVRIVEPSNNAAFDSLVQRAVQTVDRNAVLQFPKDSRRESVKRTGSFSLGKAPSKGFDYGKGDREEVRY